MRTMKTGLMVAMILLVGVAVRGEDKVTYITNLSSTTMPSLDLANRPLEKVLDELHSKVPDFHFVIFRSPNVSADEPILPPMKLENVHIDQFLTLIEDEFPGVKVKYNVDNNGAAPPLIEVNINADPSKPVATTPALPQPLVVRVFALRDLIFSQKMALRNHDVTEKQVTDDILSAVMAAQEEIEGTKPPVVKIHQPTQTLIFKGTNEQAALLDQTLRTLLESQSQWAEYRRRVESLETENDQLRHQLHLPASQPWK